MSSCELDGDGATPSLRTSKGKEFIMPQIEITTQDYLDVEGVDDICYGEGIGPNLDDLIKRMEDALGISEENCAPIDKKIVGSPDAWRG
jgi:hypothetical protein